MAIGKRNRPADFGVAQDAPADGADVLAPDALDVFESDPQGIVRPEPPPVGQAIAPAAARTPVRHAGEAFVDAREDVGPPSAWPVYLTAFAVAVMWALGPIAFAIGYRNAIAPLRDNLFALIVFGLLAAGPAVFVFFAAYMIRQGQKLAAEARRAKAMAEDMLAPAVTAAARAGHVVQGVRDEIVRAGEAADTARETLIALREAMNAETVKLIESTDSSIRTTRDLTTSLGREREEMGVLAASLDSQATRVSEAITQQARMVAEATELAETQLREAEGVLAARAADVAAAAGEAASAARVAGEDLTRHIARLETAGAGVAEQVRAVEGGLSEQRGALAALGQALKADHADFAQQAEAHAAKLEEFIGQARLSSAELGDRALKGGESLRSLMGDAAEQFRTLTETARVEREAFGQSTLESLEAVSEAAADQRAKLEAQTRAAIEALATAAEDTRAAAARHAATAREQVDQLSEAAFSAGHKANQVFEARLAEARALVEQSSQMVDEAGAASAKRLEEGAAAARATLAELQAMMAEVEARAARLPDSAKVQAEAVRQAFAGGLADLTEQARRTADEAQAIDAAFQERARRHFEMLGEAVRLMGAQAAMPPTALKPPPIQPLPRPERAAPPPAPPPRVEPDDAPDADALLEELMEPAPPRAPHAAPPSTLTSPPEGPGLRPRLRLTPTATDAEFAAVFEAAGGPPGEAAAEAEGETWTWKDLLASIDGADPEGERLQDVLGAEVAAMGVEPAKLLPKARIDEIAAAVQTGDLEGAREVVTRLAPAAVRRIARRLGSDDALRRQTQVYVRRYQTLIDDAVVRDPEGFLMASLLGDEAGRLFLLLDAASGDAA
jgi:hypothetical protein